MKLTNSWIDRLFKIGLVAAIACLFSLVVVNNLTDPETNFAFVEHVLSMDTIFPNSTLKWRAILNPQIHQLFYAVIILWEILTAGLCWGGAIQLVRSINASAVEFDQSKALSLLGLTFSALLWLVSFLCIGGEWFAMWQSPLWNGQPIAFRMFTITILIFLVIRQPDAEV